MAEVCASFFDIRTEKNTDKNFLCSLKHLIVEDSEDALTHEAVAALRGARIGELPKSISGDVCTVAPYSPSKQVCVQTRAKLEATKAELETLVLVPTGDCREWITSLSPVTIRSIKKLHVAISCAGNESGDVSQMFGGVRFPNLEDLAVIRVHPVLSRTPFGDVLNSAAGVAPKLVAFSVVDVFPISRSDEEEAPVKRGRRFDNLGMMSYVAINDQDATHKSPVFITACDICDTIITTCPTISDFTFEVTGNSVLIADSRIATTSRGQLFVSFFLLHIFSAVFSSHHSPDIFFDDTHSL